MTVSIRSFQLLAILRRRGACRGPCLQLPWRLAQLWRHALPDVWDGRVTVSHVRQRKACFPQRRLWPVTPCAGGVNSVGPHVKCVQAPTQCEHGRAERARAERSKWQVKVIVPPQRLQAYCWRAAAPGGTRGAGAGKGRSCFQRKMLKDEGRGRGGRHGFTGRCRCSQQPHKRLQAILGAVATA